METPKDILEPLNTRGDLRRMSESAQQQSAMRGNSKERLFPLWEAMSSTWSSFVSLYGEEPNPTWIAGLQEFDEPQLIAGYQRARDAGLEWPPNLSVFVEYCKGNEDWESRRIHRPYDPHAEICDRSDGENMYLPPVEDTRTVDEIRADLKKLFGLDNREGVSDERD